MRKQRSVGKHQGENDHGDRGDPGDDVEGQGVDVLAHEIAAIYQQQDEDHNDG